MLDVCWWGGSGCPLKSKGEKKKGPGGGYDVLKELRNNVDKSVEGGKELVWWSSQLIPNVNLLSLACEWLSRLRLSAANQNHWAVHETSGVSHEQGKRCCDGWLSPITFREMFPAVLKPGRETFCLYTTLCCLFPGCQLGTLIPCNVTQLCEFSATSPPVIVSLAVHQIKHDSRQSKYTNPNDCAAPQLTTDDQRQGLWSSEYWGATYRVITTPVTLTDKKKKPLTFTCPWTNRTMLQRTHRQLICSSSVSEGFKARVNLGQGSYWAAARSDWQGRGGGNTGGSSDKSGEKVRLS